MCGKGRYHAHEPWRFLRQDSAEQRKTPFAHQEFNGGRRKLCAYASIGLGAVYWPTICDRAETGMVGCAKCVENRSWRMCPSADMMEQLAVGKAPQN